MARTVNRLPQIIQDIQRRGLIGVHEAIVLGASEAAAMTPRHSSNLINSQIRSVTMQGTKVVGMAGYTADYAAAVHEAPGKLKGLPRPAKNGIAQGNYWDPSGEPEFLRKGFERAEPAIQARIAGCLRLK